MKYLLSAILAITTLSCAATANAQSAGATSGAAKPVVAKAKRRQNMLDVLAKLNLTDVQKVKAKDAIAKSVQAVRDLRAEIKAGKVSKADAKTKALAIRKANQEAIKAILTPDQLKQYAELVKQIRKENQANRPAPPSKPGGN